MLKVTRTGKNKFSLWRGHYNSNMLGLNLVINIDNVNALDTATYLESINIEKQYIAFALSRMLRLQYTKAYFNSRNELFYLL